MCIRDRLNTVLFKGHPIESFAGKGLRAVGQNPQKADFYDDKYAVNRFLAEKGLPVAPQLRVRPGDPYEGCLLYTSAFVGICVQDVRDQKQYADFRSFVYEAQ